MDNNPKKRANKALINIPIQMGALSLRFPISEIG
jgi:hypothetical protein